MENLRLINVEVKSSQDLILEFSHNLTLGIKTANINIVSSNSSIPDSEVLNVKIKDNLLFVKCQPLTPFITYYVKALKTISYPFISKDNKAILLQDNVGNRFDILGPIEKENIFKQLINQSLEDGVYSLEDNTVTSTIINSISKNLDVALDAIKNVKNENYISYTVTDELKTRGSGPFDKLNEGSAYEIIRVAPRPTNTFSTDTYIFDSSKYKLVSLQETYKTEILTPNSIDSSGFFNILNFNLNLSKQNIIKVKSIVFTLSTINPIYNYNIEKYGYQILDSKYDSDFASTYFTLESNQIKLNEEILKDENFDIAQIVKVDVEYYYKNIGKIISNVDIFSRKNVVREVLPPISTNFFLKNANIIDGDNNTPESNGLTFINLNSNTTHPAFLYEIKFRYEELPFAPGQYSINYENGNIYVYGASSSNIGSGPEPPVVSYTYKQTFQSEIDYVYDSNTYDLAILPKGKAIDKTIYVNYNFEFVFVNGEDYKANLHEESLNERINNRLTALNVLNTKNYPITNVFRIYNETSGEVYQLSRFDGNKVYFRYNTPPRILNTQEIVDFKLATEKLIPTNYSTNANTIIVAKFELLNKYIISSTNDRIASFKNTSLALDNNIFVTERNYNSIDSIQNVGEYVVDYENSLLYVGVNSLTIENFGEANYKYSNLTTINKNPLYVNSLNYIQPSTELIKVDVVSINEDSIEINNLPNSKEDSINSNPYLLINSKVGYVENSNFINKVKNEVSSIYGLYEYEDFINSTNPINFANYSNYSNKSIETNSFSKTLFLVSEYSIDGYFVEIPKEIYYNSSNITYEFTATSVLLNTDIDVLSYTIEENSNKIFLDTTTIETVKIDLLFTINNLSRVVVDYSRGDLYIDYNYLADEILVNYEFGSNSLDFRESLTIPTNSQYYVSYKVGALRDALSKNFSTLINVDEISNIDPSFNRERYRDAIYAALSSFILGPTIPAIKNIVKQIVHTEPDVKESAFNFWSLGQSLLKPKSIETNGTFEILPAKHGNGVLIDNGSIKFDTFNNLNIEEGSLGFWAIPQWNGIDNQKEIQVEVLEDNLAISSDKIFIGSTELHPESNIFTLSNVIKGSPNFNKDGLYFYLDNDESNLFERWYLRIIDGYSTATNTFKVKLNSDFYDFRIIDGYPASTTSTNSKISITSSSTAKNELYGFIADSKKYFIDMKKDKSRFSLYKDKSGYLVFEIIDTKGKRYSISKDVSDWISGEAHQIYLAWRVGSKSKKDELHLFIDGQEVSNISKYSDNIRNYIHQEFRTISKESFIGVSGKDIVGSIDLETTSGSNIVSSLINFAAYNVSIGDRIYIFNDLFDSAGYEITNISGQDLTLDTAMPVSLTDLEFSVNKTIFDGYGRYYLNNNNYFYKLSHYYTESDLSTNSTDVVTSLLSDFDTIASVGDLIRINDSQFDNYYTIVSISGNTLTLDSTLPVTGTNYEFFIYSTNEIELRSPRAEVSDYEFDRYQIIVKNGLNSNELLFAESLGLNHEIVKGKYYQWSDNLSNIIKTQLPKPISTEDVIIKKILLDSYSFNSTNTTLSGLFGTKFDGSVDTDNPINSQSGRKVKVILNGSNIDFTYPVNIEVFGNVNYINTSEILSFTDYGELETTNLFFSVNQITIDGYAINTSKPFCSVKCIESESIFEPEISYFTPVLKYSYVVNQGTKLEKNSSNTVIDLENKFSISNVGDSLLIEEPVEVAGFYRITGVNYNILEIDPYSTGYTLPIDDFTDGYYKVVRHAEVPSGTQNGFFNFEPLDYPGQQYLLRKGYYEFLYPSYISINFELPKELFIGSDINSENHCNSIINELCIYNTVLSDVRAGESTSDIDSVTKNFNLIKGTKNTKNLIFKSTFNSFPFENESLYYAAIKDNNIIYANSSLNEEFENAVYLNNRNIQVENLGYLDSKKEGTIEFWVSPIFDTVYDYNKRYYFDSSSAISEEVTSLSKKTLELSSKAKEILSVKTLNSDINYFSGGRIDYYRNDSINEIVTSSTSNKVVISQEASQILYVKANNYSVIDYFDDGVIASDGKTIYLNKSLPNDNVSVVVSYKPKEIIKTNSQVIILGKELPSNNTKVVVNYIPKGSNGDRISIYKDEDNLLNFEIKASDKNYSIRAPIVWERNSWHRIKASYKFNSINENLLLFIDGYKYNSLSYENDVFRDQPYIYGSTYVGDGYDGYSILEPIVFKDTLNYFTIGSDYTNKNYGNVLIDNLRISNKYREPFKYLNESIDINYLGNSSLPVVKDLYTTYLLDSNISYELFEDFASIVNKKSGIYEFTLDIFDSFNILKDNPQSKKILERLLKILKPANSRIFLNYF